MARTPGPKGAKSSTLSLRLTARTRYGLALLARVNHMPLGRVVEEALELCFYGEGPGTLERRPAGKQERVAIMDMTWDAKPWVRLGKLAVLCPELLSKDEAELWLAVQADKSFWKREGISTDPKQVAARMNHDALEAGWPALTERFDVGI